MEEDVRSRIEIDQAHCPYCREGLRSDDSKVGCEACMAWQHRECAQTHGACVSCGHELAGILATPVASERDDEVRAIEAIWATQRAQFKANRQWQRYTGFAAASVFVIFVFVLLLLLVS